MTKKKMPNPTPDTGDDAPPPAWLDAWKRERRAGTPLVALATPDVPAAVRAIAKACNGSAPCVEWSCSAGIRAMNRPGQEAVQRMCDALGGALPESVVTPSDALVAAGKLPERAVLVMTNAHLAWSQPMVRDAAQRLRDDFKQDGRMLVFAAPDVADLPREVGADTRTLREELPRADERRRIIADTYGDAAIANGLPDLTEPDLAEAVRATAGLTAFAVEQAAAVAIRREGLDIPTLRTTAREVINSRRGLRVSDEGIAFDKVGGLGALSRFIGAVATGPDRFSAVVLWDEVEKMMAGSGGGDLSGVSSDILGVLLSWMERRRVHGVLLMGPPGSGKSLSAQAAAGQHNVPLIWMDIGGMKGSLVGESGANVRAALDTIDSVVGEGRVLVVATCNGVAELRPELLRRFKPRFVVDLPSPETLPDIWRIQLAAHGLPADAPLPDAEGWTGAEVRDACAIARATGTTPRDAAAYIVPISVSAADTIRRVRTEATGRFIDANSGGPYRGPSAPGAARQDPEERAPRRATIIE